MRGVNASSFISYGKTRDAPCIHSAPSGDSCLLNRALVVITAAEAAGLHFCNAALGLVDRAEIGLESCQGSLNLGFTHIRFSMFVVLLFLPKPYR